MARGTHQESPERAGHDTNSAARRRTYERYLVTATHADGRQIGVLPLTRTVERARSEAIAAARRRFGNKWARTATYRVAMAPYYPN